MAEENTTKVFQSGPPAQQMVTSFQTVEQSGDLALLCQREGRARKRIRENHVHDEVTSELRPNAGAQPVAWSAS